MKIETISVKITNKTTNEVTYPKGTKRVLEPNDVAWDDDGESIVINTGEESKFTPEEVQKLLNYAEDLKVRAKVRTKHDPNKKLTHEHKQQQVMARADELGITLQDFQQAITNGNVKEWVNRHYNRLADQRLGVAAERAVMDDQTEAEDDQTG